jgi:hypothetical protein
VQAGCRLGALSTDPSEIRRCERQANLQRKRSAKQNGVSKGRSVRPVHHTQRNRVWVVPISFWSFVQEAWAYSDQQTTHAVPNEG